MQRLRQTVGYRGVMPAASSTYSWSCNGEATRAV